MTIGEPTGADVDSFVVSIPLQIPNSAQFVDLDFVVTITYCQVESFTFPDVPIRLEYTIFEEEPLTFTVGQFGQVPDCEYELMYRWQYFNQTSETITALPEIFQMSDREISVQTDDKSLAGSYTL